MVDDQTRLTLSSEQLNKVWVRFLLGKNLDPARLRYFSSSNYNYVSRKLPLSREFENWLFDHGGIVRQENRQRYVEFINQPRGLLFILRHL